MKVLKYFFLLVLLLTLKSCDKQVSDEVFNLDVETYVELLKSNQYEYLDLPDFDFEDISELLQYRNEDQIITNFPYNPLSSFYDPESKLGMYILWTIESIRVASATSQQMNKRFPSQNPVLELRDSEKFTLVSDSLSHNVAASAYYDWWINNNQKDFDEFKSIDPLEKTNYKWH